MSLPRLAIQICTFNRLDTIRQTVEGLIEHLDYPQDLITLYVCDDSSPGDYTKKLARLKMFKHWPTEFYTTEKNSGWGANVNNGLDNIVEDYTFFIEDDYVLTKHLDLVQAVALFEARPNIGMLRFRGTAGGHFIYHQFEADVSQVIPESVVIYEAAGALQNKLTYLQLDQASHSLYVYSHGAHLKHRRFHDFYGKYPEGIRLAETEESYAHTVKDKMRADPNHAPAIAILPDWITMSFLHIGESYQNSEFDV